MHFVAWNGEIWSGPFQPNELVPDGCDGLRTREGCSVAWNEDGYRGENWIVMSNWSEQQAEAIMRRTKKGRR
jgi:hypothetical protein